MAILSYQEIEPILYEYISAREIEVGDKINHTFDRITSKNICIYMLGDSDD